MESQPETEQRLHLNGPLFEQPGTSQPRRRQSRTRARETPMPGRTMRAERRDADRQAGERQVMTLEQRLAQYRAMVSSGELEYRAPDRKRQRLVDARPSVWQLGSWVDGDKPCPDEYLSWE